MHETEEIGSYIVDIPYVCKKPEMDVAVHSPQIRSSETAVVYVIVCGTFVAIQHKCPVLHKSQQKAQLKCASKVHQSQVGTIATLL